METKQINAVKTSNALMKKTKAELVNIILRKDDVEKELKEDNKVLLEHNSRLSEEVQDVTKDLNDERSKYAELKSDYQTECDVFVMQRELWNKTQKTLKMFLGAFVVATILLIISIVVLVNP